MQVVQAHWQQQSQGGLLGPKFHERAFESNAGPLKQLLLLNISSSVITAMIEDATAIDCKRMLFIIVFFLNNYTLSC